MDDGLISYPSMWIESLMEGKSVVQTKAEKAAVMKQSSFNSWLTCKRSLFELDLKNKHNFNALLILFLTY